MTAIYKTGTVSVNNGSNIVTGNGTSFIDVANVQEGDLFTLDGQKFYEIYEVDTNTQIKIRNIVTGGAFAETNVSAGNFAIIRNFTSQTSAEIAAKVLAVQQKWQNREEEMTDWFYTSDNWATVTSINGDELTVMTPEGINNLLGTAATEDITTSRYDTATGRLLKSGDAGLLSSSAPTASQFNSADDLDLLTSGGFWAFGGASNGAPYTNGGSLIVAPFTTNRTLQIGNEHNDPNIGFRYKSEVGAYPGEFSPWYDFCHSGNTNFNEVIGEGTTGTILVAQPYSATEIRFYIPIFKNRTVGSITVDGSFSLSFYQNAVATGLDFNDITLLSSSRNLAVIRITSLTGLDTTRDHILYAEQASAKIILNFNA